MAINDTTPCTTAATVASSTGQRLAAIAERVYSAGPQAVLRALCATYDASSRLFRANVKGPKTLLGSVPITITVKIGTTTVATKTVNITIVK